MAHEQDVPFEPDSLACEPIAQLTKQQLNSQVGDPLPGLGVSLYDLFNEDGLLPPFDASESALFQGSQGSMGAHNGVSLYRLSYDTVVPETGQRERVSGLLAIPDLDGLAERSLPLLSWQHGTIFEAADAPSQLFQDGKLQCDALGIPRSAETWFNVVRFAGNGFVVSAADYVGNGLSRLTQAYAVKDATVQTLLHQLEAARTELGRRGLSVGPLFLNGWSQGGLNTQWFGWALQERGIPVSGMAAVSAPTDLPALVSYWMNNFPGSPNWLTAAMPLLFGSYETYYGMAGLMAEAIRSQYLPIASEIDAKTYDWAHVNWRSANPICKPNSLTDPRICLPVLALDMLNPDFLAACNRGDHPFMRQIRANTALQGRYAMPCRFYGGSGDAVVPGWSSMLLPVEHQQRLGSTLASAVPVTVGDTHTPAGASRPGGTHRSTFLASLFDPGLSMQRWLSAVTA